MKAFKDLRISVGAENVYFEEKGAYTGEVSAEMLKDLGVKYVIVGHSERRQYFCETDQTVNKKVHAVLNAGMNPIICVGESLEQRETGVTDEWIALQVKSALSGVPAEKLRRCIIAYEPIWAIGTGKTATGRAGRRGLLQHPRHDPRPVRRPGGPQRHHSVRRLHEPQERRRAAGSAGYRRRPYRRRRP